MWQLVILGVLLWGSAFFSLVDSALRTTGKVRLKHLAEQGSTGARVAVELLEEPNRLRGVLLVGDTLANISVAAVGTALAVETFGSRGVGVAIAAVGLLVLILGEIVPRAVGAGFSEAVAVGLARPLQVVAVILRPVAALSGSLANGLMWLSGRDGLGEGAHITEEEIRNMVDVGAEAGVLEHGEGEMIHSVFEFGDTEVKEVMRPRIDIFCIPVDVGVREVLDSVVKEGYSRIPVYEGTVDNIVGVVYVKDLLRTSVCERLDTPIKDVMRPAYYVPESKKVDELFRELQRAKVHMAIVLDEYGGTAGLVTIEDLIEEVFGEIQDEYDAEELPLQRINEDVAVVDARMAISEVNEELGIALPEEDADTIGGFVFNLLGRVPSVGEKVFHDGLELIVEKLDKRRIARVQVAGLNRRPEPQPESLVSNPVSGTVVKDPAINVKVNANA
ncbi:MAG: hemolysin family protein [Syntrophothermus sp.]